MRVYRLLREIVIDSRYVMLEVATRRYWSTMKKTTIYRSLELQTRMQMEVLIRARDAY